jgi:hypothetical protein
MNRLAGISVSSVLVGHLVHYRNPFHVMGIGLLFWTASGRLSMSIPVERLVSVPDASLKNFTAYMTSFRQPACTNRLLVLLCVAVLMSGVSGLLGSYYLLFFSRTLSGVGESCFVAVAPVCINDNAGDQQGESHYRFSK